MINQLEKQLESSVFPKLEVFNIGIIALNIVIKINCCILYMKRKRSSKTEGRLSNVMLVFTIYEEE